MKNPAAETTDLCPELFWMPQPNLGVTVMPCTRKRGHGGRHSYTIQESEPFYLARKKGIKPLLRDATS